MFDALQWFQICKRKCLDIKTIYILANIYVSFGGFLRSFVYMKQLDLYDLGLVSILQTIIMLICMLQLGLLNGGYRVFSIGHQKDTEKTNNIIFTYFLWLLLLSLCIIIFLFILKIKINLALALIGVVIGILTLSVNWMQNVLIAISRLKEINFLNIVSCSLAIILLPAINYTGLYGAIIIILIQPLTFCVLAFLLYVEVRPKKLEINIHYSRYLLSFGFIPFITGIFSYANIQIERWSIVYWMDTEHLGLFYLPTMYVALFLLVPNSLNNLYFPSSIKLYVEGRDEEVKNQLSKFFVMLLVYCTVAVLLTIFCADIVVMNMFPKHQVSLQFVYIIIPGLVALTLISPIGIIFNASVKLKPMLWAYLISSFITIFMIFVFVRMGNFDLKKVAIIESFVNIIISGVFVSSFLYMHKNIWQPRGQ